MKKYFYSVLIMAIFAIGFAASSDEQDAQDTSNNGSGTTASSSSGTQEELVSHKSINQIKDVDELRQAINNTVWTYTAKGDEWLRYEFVGNTVKQYSALPHDGKWQYDGESSFDLSEQRSNYDGKRYIIATFMPKTKSLAMFELAVVFNFRDYHLYLNGEDMGGFVMADYEWD